jgi:Sulfocyanin (SoxE) domain
MPTSHSTRLLALALATGAGVSCSSPNKSDQSPPMETAASVATPQKAATTTSDTSPSMETPETSAAQAAPVKASTAPRARASASRTSTAPKPTASPSAPAADSASATPAPAAATGQEKWLSYDAATKTVTFELIAGPFTFNGFRNGGGTLVVPASANVVMNFVNKDGTPHSAIVISGEGPIPNSATDPAIQRAYTNKVLEGLPQEGTDVMRFPVPASGTYRIFCGVPGHGLSGMWIWMKIDPAAKAPTFGATKG